MDHHARNAEQAFIVLVEHQLHAYHVQLEHLVDLMQDLAQLVQLAHIVQLVRLLAQLVNLLLMQHL